MDWFPDWSGQACVIIAAGPSAKNAPLQSVRGHAKLIAINSSYKLAPWADVLYGCDFGWWRAFNGVPEFQGLKITQDNRILQQKGWGVKLIAADRNRKDFVMKPRGRVGWAGHSGHHAINLALQFGSRRLLLVGFDMHIDKGAHWHGLHPKGLNNPTKPTIKRWRIALDEMAGKLRELGAEVINCSLDSALTAYPKMELGEALYGDRRIAA